MTLIASTNYPIDYPEKVLDSLLLASEFNIDKDSSCIVDNFTV